MNQTIKIFNYRFKVKEFLPVLFFYLMLESIFSWLFVPVSIYILGYEKLLSIFIYGFMLYKFASLRTSEKIYIGIFTILMIRLVFESLDKFGTVFQQFTMFTVLFPVIFTLFIKYLLRSLQLDLLEFLSKFYLITYIIFMVIYGRGFSFSLEAVEMVDYGPFSGDSRVIHASHIFMMIIPFLWYLDQYIKTGKLSQLIPFFFCIGIILLHQHRSVWSSTIVALVIYLFSSIRANKHMLSRFGYLLVTATMICAGAYFILSYLVPDMIHFFAERFSEILDPAKEGSTGNFRIEQRDTYYKLFLERPIFGWTFEGFEMSNPLVDWWPEKTGQHFHEGYMEMMFYHGLVGVFFKYSFLIYLFFKIFSKNISQESIILIGFTVSGLLFSLNYVLPLIFWGHVGMCLCYLEQDHLAYLTKRMDRVMRIKSESQELNLSGNSYTTS